MPLNLSHFLYFFKLSEDLQIFYERFCQNRWSSFTEIYFVLWKLFYILFLRSYYVRVTGERFLTCRHFFFLLIWQLSGRSRSQFLVWEKMDEITVRCSFLEVKFCLLEVKRERFDCDPSKYLYKNLKGSHKKTILCL